MCGGAGTLALAVYAWLFAVCSTTACLQVDAFTLQAIVHAANIDCPQARWPESPLWSAGRLHPRGRLRHGLHAGPGKSSVISLTPPLHPY